MHGFYCLNVGEANAMEIKIKRIIIIKESEKIKSYLSNQWVIMGGASLKQIKRNATAIVDLLIALRMIESQVRRGLPW
jgi:hypothetical protein